ncbi:pleckstrin homology domain-containing family G member 1-like isoform X2 [Acipenser ruthenus]|nr:pleckstrin homology domain-containing family G member 1-like isoform X2 [Acipenser ruthenus]
MPDKELQGTESISRNEDDYHLPPDALPPLPEVPDGRTALSTVPLGRFHSEKRTFRYCSVRSMDSSDSDRPVSYSSTSSSASSRDSHCSLGSRTTLVSNSRLGLGPALQDRDVGAIRLELVPARQLDCRERQGSQVEGTVEDEKRLSGVKRTDSKGSGKHNATSTPAVEPASPKLLYVDRVVQEILDTERTYVQDLQSIVQDYLDCITDQSRLALGTEERSELFGNIRDIYHFNSELLQDLENCHADPVAIAECFVAKSEDFHIYTQYCTNYPRSVAVLTECMRNKALSKFFRERQEALQHSLPLGSYLLKPVQRILKYHLLLHEIANHLDKDTEAYDVVLDAIDTMQRVAWHINDMKRKHEHAVRLQEIQSLLTNWKGPDLISYGELVLEGTFRIQRAKNERTLFLFDKLLLITKKREESYAYKAHILCCNLMLVEVIPKEPLSFSVFHYKNPKLQHTVQARSQQDKRLWILYLKRLILENHPAKIPAKAKQAILEMDAAHHPGFHYSPDGEKKAALNSKEGGNPRRVRRKSEPSARLQRGSKQNEISSDVQKRISVEGSLLSQAAKLGSTEDLLNSSGREGSPVNQSRESLDPAYPSDPDERLRMHAGEQADADDEDDTEQGVELNSKTQTKGGRKRLNSQASENVEKRRSLNVGTHNLQTSKESKDTGHSGNNNSTTNSARHPARQSGTQSNSDLNVVLGGPQAVRNIWTDHQIRQALFSSQQPAHQTEEEEDIYQMFVPSVSSPNRNVTRVKEGNRGPGRPCSWHVGQPEQKTPEANRKVIRRASSVGEQNSDFKPTICDGNKPKAQDNSLQVDEPSRVSTSESSDQLTIDDIENIYDNISYEDMKSMGLIRRERDCMHIPQGAVAEKTNSGVTFTERPVSHNENSGSTDLSLLSDTYKAKAQNSDSFGSCELKIVEENIYDTIGVSDPPLETYKSDTSKRDSFFGLEADFACCDSLEGFISEESLQFSEDDTSDHRVPEDRDLLGWVDSSSNSDSLSHRSVADKLSEEVDEIWNDLESYIKKNEKKPEHLPAAFPVSKHDVQEETHAKSVPDTHREEVHREAEYSASTFSIPENTGFTKTVKKKLARLSTGSFRFDECDSHKDRSSFSRSSFTSELGNLESSQTSTNSILSNTSSESSELGVDIVDKTKNRVFMMARQYSQKIKKANQMLKMRSPDQENAPGKPKSRQKDLAAILEEKKQGGPAIGARIAEYTHLYDQIVFRDTPPRAQKIGGDNTSESLVQNTPQSQLTSQRYSQLGSDSNCLDEDWLHATYSNRELSDFISWPDEPVLSHEDRSDAAQRKLSQACSVPALKSVTHPHAPTQRWSAFISQPNKENFDQEHVYNSLGRRPASAKSNPYNWCQSSSSVMVNNRTVESTIHQNQRDRNPVTLNRNSVEDRHHNSILSHKSEHMATHEEQRQSVAKQTSEDHSDMILQDSQKVLVVSRNSLLNAHIATQNYFANFKDADDDDEDYVEIKSEDEEQDLASERSLNGGLASSLKEPCSRRLSFSTPCSPVKTLHSNIGPGVSLIDFTEQDKLNEYLWRVPPENQQNIVQSLRQKFHCLSSSSFASAS